MKKTVLSLILGCIAGIINIIPMAFQNLELQVLVSNLIIWLSIGLFISTSNFKTPSFIKGFLVAILISAPSIVYIISSSFIGFVWTIIWTGITGAALGIILDKIKN